MTQQVLTHSLFSDLDIYLFRTGKHTQLYKKLGAHRGEVDGVQGLYFAVYAPGASHVQVIGDWNGWNGHGYSLDVRWDSSGIWEGFIPGLDYGLLYKYRIYSHHDDIVRDKADPFGFCTEVPSLTSTISWDMRHEWEDDKWMASREKTNALGQPCSVYEVHLGSWKKNENGDSLSYRQLAEQLVPYVKKQGFTHVELMPVMEHPYYPSWGYQSTSYFAPSRRYGDPEDFAHLIDAFHQADIGVYLDWVPSHFAVDGHGLGMYDGSHVYEHPDHKKGFHPDWNSSIFNYERPEVVSFLLSSAHYWLDVYHADGIRVDAVASMIYLDYSRDEGQWDPNEHGGNEYIAAVNFIKELNTSVFAKHTGVQMIAEESTSYSGVTRPVHLGGLGFTQKWMMGWMNDTLQYFGREAIHRKYHHGEISFSMVYAYSENYVLPLSHDEVVHGKGSLVMKMPGDEWQKFAHLRLLLCYMYTHPGNKLLFMGAEIGQVSEWNVNSQLEWPVLQHPNHAGIQELVRDLNHLYKKEKALHQYDFYQEGFEWIDHGDTENCVLAYIRRAGKKDIVTVMNFTPQTLTDYEIGVNQNGVYREVLSSDEEKYWGSGMSNSSLKSKKGEKHGKAYTLSLTVPPLGAVILKKA